MAKSSVKSDKKNNVLLICLICIIVILFLGSVFYIVLKNRSLWSVNSLPGENAAFARIYSDGRLVREIDLSLAKDEVFEIQTENGGYNTVTVKDHDICVSSASCPDGLCMKEGYALSSPVPIVCLPNRLVITVERKESGKEEHYDAVTY